MNDEAILSSARAVRALAVAADIVREHAPRVRELDPAARRGWFRPEEEERLIDWFARFLSIREALWEVIGDGITELGDDPDQIANLQGRRAFVVTYAAACVLVGLDRLLVDEVAVDSTIQRKLNEGDAARRIPRKQFTVVFESLTNPRNALILDRAMRWLDEGRSDIEALTNDEVVGEIVRAFPVLESPLDRSRRRYLDLLVRYGNHAVRRAGASARQQILFGLLEKTGQWAAERRAESKPDRVDDRLRERISELLRPGDVLVTRHDGALTNLVLPGFWPHAALYVGSADGGRAMGISVDAERAARWVEPRRVLEALKDGVLFRPLTETLAVDAVAVIRPRLPDGAIARALERAIWHEGKLYDFDFDFFRADRLVCTEVVWRGFDGILDDPRFTLRERAGRPTLAAEDLLDLALDTDLFAPIAVFGARGCEDRLVVGEEARAALAATYREQRNTQAP